MQPPVIVIGASARAACQSLARLGVAAIGIDLFADLDLRESGVARRIRDYPSEFATAIDEFPVGEWMYVGGVENYPELIRRISRRKRLLGNDGDATARLCDPFDVAETLSAGGFRFPVTCRTLPGNQDRSRWLHKPRKSCGGHRVLPADVSPAIGDADSFVYQQFVDGVSHSAVYLAAAGHTRLIGVTRQWLARDFDAGPPFQYVGSCGPLPISPAIHEVLHGLGECLASTYCLQGLFNVDYVAVGDQIWTVEINPRYSASVEVLERRLPYSLMACHLAACRDAALPDSRIVAPSSRQHASLLGKAIVYSRRDGVLVDAFDEYRRLQNERVDGPWVADIPHAGEEHLRGQPICTVFAEGRSVRDVQAKLVTSADRVHGFLTHH